MNSNRGINRDSERLVLGSPWYAFGTKESKDAAKAFEDIVKDDKDACKDTDAKCSSSQTGNREFGNFFKPDLD